MNKSINNSVLFHLKAVITISFLVIVIYSNTLNCGFVFDDLQNIVSNPYIRLTGFSLNKLIHSAIKSPMPTRPLANISFALNYYFGKYSVVQYHIINILIHIINGVLVYFLYRLTLKQICNIKPDKFPFPEFAINFIPLFGALIFVSHPIQVQSVTYIVQRMNSMATMFYFLAMLCYIKGRISKIKWKQRTLCICCFIFWILALGSKEITAILPLTLILYEWYFFQDLKKDWIKENYKYFIAIIFLFGLTAYIFLGKNPIENILNSYAHRDFTMGERVLTQLRVVVYYLSLLLYPNPSRLNLLHHITISNSLFNPVTTFFSLLVLVGIIVTAISLSRKERLISFCIIWFFLHLAIESSIIGLEIIFEHRLYLPMFGFSLAVAYIIFSLPSVNRTLTFILSAVIILSLGTATYLRNRTWHDSTTLWTDVVYKSPESPRAQYNLGSDLARKKHYKKAVYHFSKALKLKPDYAKAENNLGLTLFKQGKPDKAIYHFYKALQIQPGNSAAHYNLGLALEKKGDLKAAVKHYLKAIQLKPDFAKAHNSLGIALQEQKRFEEAIYHFSKALKLKPDFAKAHNNMGYALEMQGDIKKAIEHYLTALQIRPDDGKIYNNLGVSLTRLGILNQAINCYRKALQLNPDDAGAYNNMGVVLMKQGKTGEAINNYSNALRIKPDYAQAHNNMGIALMKQKYFKKAVYHFTRALNIQPDDMQVKRNFDLASGLMNKISGTGKDKKFSP